MAAALAHPAVIPVGAIKQFGEFGPEYQVLGSAPSEDGKARVRIVLIRTGEETTYGLDAMLSDPEAH
jgi:hypothetical protein